MDGVAIMAEEFRKEKAEREKAKVKPFAEELKDALAQFTPPPAPATPEPKAGEPEPEPAKPEDVHEDDGK